MKLKSFVAVMLGVSSIVIAGCATIVSGTTQEVTFQSTPEDATVKIDGKTIGKTPLTIPLEKKAEQTLVVEKEGYKTFSTKMDTTLDPWFWGNIVIGGFLGSTTDGVSGAINRYAPGQFIVTLEPDMTSQLDAEVQMAPKDKARQFLFVNYQNLRKELSTNSGEYISAMLDMLNVMESERQMAIQDIKELMLTSKNAESFVNATIRDYFDA